MFTDPEIDSDDEGVQTKREELLKKARDAVSKGRSLLGGQDVDDDDDAYMTTAQRAAFGIPDGKRKAAGTKKLTRASAQEISPITGEKICDYGTWAADFEEKAKAANPPPKRKPAFVANADDMRIVKMLKQQLVSRGAKGFIGLQRKFRIMDDDRSGSLDPEEFKKAMRECGLFLTAPELERLFKFFDRDCSNTIDFNEFIFALRGDLSERRKKLVNMAFDVMDIDGNGVLEPSDVISAYDASKHPDVLAGKSTPEKVLAEFLDNFDVGGEKDGMVTRNEFENYYSNISASIDNEDYFELMIRNAWHIAGGEGQAANSSNLRVRVTKADGSSSIETVKNDLGLKRTDKKGIITRLRAQGVDVVDVDTGGAMEDEKPKPKSSASASSASSAPSAPAPTPRRDSEPGVAASTRRESKRSVASEPVQALGQAAAGTGSKGAATLREQAGIGKMPADKVGTFAGMELTHPALEKLQNRIKKKGIKGFVGMQRLFRKFDVDGNKQLDKSEFKQAMKDLKTKLTDVEVNSLFTHFDKDKGGTIDFDEFVIGVRGGLNERRKNLVHMAFDIMDKDGNGVIEPKDIMAAYDASKHPDVISGKRTAEDVFTEFLDTFDVGGEKDGMVTRNEFENYYSNISASIDNEDYFELMMRNAWRIAGGEGQAANTANTRVLVTRNDGSQAVETVINDMGLRQGDKADLEKRLRAQGTEFTALDTTGDMEDKGSSSNGSAKNLKTAVAAPKPPKLSSRPSRVRPPVPGGAPAAGVNATLQAAETMAKGLKIKAVILMSQRKYADAKPLLEEAVQALVAATEAGAGESSLKEGICTTLAKCLEKGKL